MALSHRITYLALLSTKAMAIHKEDIFDPDGYRRFRAFGPFIDPDAFEIMPTTYVSSEQVQLWRDTIPNIQHPYTCVHAILRTRGTGTSFGFYLMSLRHPAATCMIGTNGIHRSTDTALSPPLALYSACPWSLLSQQPILPSSRRETPGDPQRAYTYG